MLLWSLPCSPSHPIRQSTGLNSQIFIWCILSLIPCSVTDLVIWSHSDPFHHLFDIFFISFANSRRHRSAPLIKCYRVEGGFLGSDLSEHSCEVSKWKLRANNRIRFCCCFLWTQGKYFCLCVSQTFHLWWTIWSSHQQRIRQYHSLDQPNQQVCSHLLGRKIGLFRRLDHFSISFVSMWRKHLV